MLKFGYAEQAMQMKRFEPSVLTNPSHRNLRAKDSIRMMQQDLIFNNELPSSLFGDGSKKGLWSGKSRVEGSYEDISPISKPTMEICQKMMLHEP